MLWLSFLLFRIVLSALIKDNRGFSYSAGIKDERLKFCSNATIGVIKTINLNVKDELDKNCRHFQSFKKLLFEKITLKYSHTDGTSDEIYIFWKNKKTSIFQIICSDSGNWNTVFINIDADLNYQIESFIHQYEINNYELNYISHCNATISKTNNEKISKVNIKENSLNDKGQRTSWIPPEWPPITEWSTPDWPPTSNKPSTPEPPTVTTDSTDITDITDSLDPTETTENDSPTPPTPPTATTDTTTTESTETTEGTETTENTATTDSSTIIDSTEAPTESTETTESTRITESTETTKNISTTDTTETTEETETTEDTETTDGTVTSDSTATTDNTVTTDSIVTDETTDNQTTTIPTASSIPPTSSPTNFDYHGPWLVVGVVFIVLTIGGFVLVIALSVSMPPTILPPQPSFTIPRPVNLA